MKMTGAFYKCRTLALVAILFSLNSVTPLMPPSTVTPEGAAEKGTSRASSKTTLGGATVAESPTVQPSSPWNKLRLPKTLTPQHYDVELQPYLQKDSRGLYIFKGKSTAYFTCANATNLILIHSNKLNYTMQGGFLISLKVADGSPAPAIKRTWLETPTQYLVVELNRNLEVGKEYSLYSKFTGELADDLAGFYRSEYKDGNETRIIATTQMEPADARKAFPCFDEPAMKATFNITVVHMPQFVAISNMPRISTVPKVIDGVTWHATTFQRSPKMSTYLLACVVSDFDKVEQTNNGVQIRIWARKKAIEQNQGAYALNVTGLILNFYTNYYNTSYPLPKSDQVALPDFSAGAMENWGLITYSESYLLFDPQVWSMSNKGHTLTVIAHELAHQWFGNLVTIRWWNDIWLNEGSATYIDCLGADQAEPTWNMKDLMVFNKIYPAMGTDALASSHPLSSNEEEVNSPDEINSLFDVISYCKGAAVIRMMAAFLSEELFVKGLSSYLHANAYGNTIYSDLCDHLQKAVDHQTLIKLPKSIKTIMDTWVLQMGFPVVTVNTATGEISQKHFLLDPESNVTRPSEFNYVWTVPVTSMKKGVRQPDYWLQETSAINDAWKVAPGSSDWILVNLNVTGFYRVNYDEANWKRILQQLNKDPRVIPIINRAQIISDTFNLARAQHLSITSALETTKFLSKETEYLPWQAALTSMRYFRQMFDRSSDYGPMRQYLRKKVIPLFQHFKTVTSNWTYLPRELTKQYNEMNAFSAACTYGIQECLTLASDLYKKWMADPTNNPVPPILRPAIYCNAIALGGEKEWDFAWEMSRNTGVASEADDLRAALTCSKEPWILNRYLEYTLDATKIQRQDAAYIIYLIAANTVGQSLAWDFLRAKWELLFNVLLVFRFGPSFPFSDLITGVTQRFSSKFELAQLEQFKKDNEHIGFGSGARALEQALENTKANIKWMQENREPVRLWFEAESRSSS